MIAMEESLTRNLLILLVAAAAFLALMLALPLQSFAGTAHATSHPKKTTCKPAKTAKPKAHKPAGLTAGQNDITFGIRGGNIQTWTATIAGDGTVTTTGWEKSRNAKLMEAQPALNGLFKLADAEGFFTMPQVTSCSGTNPDVATRYISMDSGSGSRQVAVHGTCVQGFNELYAVLANEVDLQH